MFDAHTPLTEEELVEIERGLIVVTGAEIHRWRYETIRRLVAEARNLRTNYYCAQCREWKTGVCMGSCGT